MHAHASAECQKLAWKAGHKRQCVPASAPESAAAAGAGSESRERAKQLRPLQLTAQQRRVLGQMLERAERQYSNYLFSMPLSSSGAQPKTPNPDPTRTPRPSIRDPRLLTGSSQRALAKNTQHFADASDPQEMSYNREKHRCLKCGGSGICEVNRRRSRCKSCCSFSICEHNRERSSSKSCGGSSICEHNRRRSECKSFGGSAIWEHNRLRSECKSCGGSRICESHRLRSECKSCSGPSGSSMCHHMRISTVATVASVEQGLCFSGRKRSMMSRADAHDRRMQS
jgi:hypothetical protein